MPRGRVHGRRRRRGVRRSDPHLALDRRLTAPTGGSQTPASTRAAAARRSRPAARRWTSLRGAPLLDAARIGARADRGRARRAEPAKRHAAELAADALHRALGAGGARARAAGAGRSRTLVAMSGGVDSAVAALLVAREGREAVGVTLELWSDPENDGELSCCSAQAVRAARASSRTLSAWRTSRSTCARSSARASSTAGWRTTRRSHAEPVRALQRQRPPRRDARARRAAGRAHARHRPLRARGGWARCCGWRGRRQGSELRALGARARVARAPALPARRDAQAAGARAGREAGPGGRAQAATRRTCASSRGRATARSSSATARSAHGPGRSSTRAARVLGEHRGAHSYTVGQRHGLGIGGARAAVRARDRRAAPTPSRSARARRCSRAACRCARLTLHRDGACVDGVRVRSHGRRFRLPPATATSRRAGTTRARIELEQPAERTAPGQLACLYAGDVVVGHGTDRGALVARP